MERIVTYFNGQRGLETLARVLDAGHEVLAAVIPERLRNSDVQAKAEALGADVWPVRKVNDPAFVERLKAARPRLGLIAGYSTIFRAPLIEAPELGTINLHAGPVPGYRGGSPLNWQIINGETTLGISVIRTDEGIDTGPLLASATFELGPDETIADAHAKAIALFPGLVLSVIEGLDAGTLTETPQSEEGTQYWHQRRPEDGRIDWPAMTARQVHDLVRAVTRPYPGAFAEWNGKTLRIFAVRAEPEPLEGPPGTVHERADGLAIACVDGHIRVLDFEIGDAPQSAADHT